MIMSARGRRTRGVPRNMPVMTAKCTTCPFGEHGDLQVQASVTSRLLRASQECHSAGWPHASHLCRGARAWQRQVLHRMGFLLEPTDVAWQKALAEIGDK